MSGAQPLFTDFAAAPRVEANGNETATLLSLEQSSGRSRVDEFRAAAATSIGSLGDERYHRYLYVLDGDWTIVVAGEARHVSAGTTLVAPRGAGCSGSVAGPAAGRLLVMTFPNEQPR